MTCRRDNGINGMRAGPSGAVRDSRPNLRSEIATTRTRNQCRTGALAGPWAATGGGAGPTPLEGGRRKAGGTRAEVGGRWGMGAAP